MPAATVSSLWIVLTHALSWAGLSLFAGALLANVLGGGAALVVPVLSLFSFFTGVGQANSILSNPINRFATQCMDTFGYQFSFMRNQFSMAAASEVLRGALTLIFVLLGAALLSPLLRGYRRSEIPAAPERGASALPAALIPALVTLAFGALLLVSGNFNGIPDGNLSSAVITTVLEVVLTLILGFGVYFCLYSLVGGFDPGATFPLSLTVACAMAVGAFSIIGYVMCYRLGLINTILPVCEWAVLNPFTLTFAFVLALTRPRQTRTRVLLALAAAAFAAAFCVGNYTGSIIYTSRVSSMNLSGLSYRVLSGLGDGFTYGLAGLTLMLCAIPAAACGLLSLKGEE